MSASIAYELVLWLGLTLYKIIVQNSRETVAKMGLKAG